MAHLSDSHSERIKQPTAGIPRTSDGKPDLAAAAPKASDGRPDFTGVWTMFPAGGGLTKQLKPADMKPWAVALQKERDENLGLDSHGTQCLPFGILVGGAWMGYSVGHWEGDTLVVESTGYNERTWLETGYPHTENLRIKERWQRKDFGHMSIDASLSDPAIYVKPWTVNAGGVYTADTDLLEYVCAENEKDRKHEVGKKSDDTKDAVKLAPEILSKYAGRYELRAKDLTGVDVVPLKVELEDGGLKLGIADGPGEPMVALSEVTFTGFGGYIDFSKDGGYVTIRIAEGDFRANRSK